MASNTALQNPRNKVGRNSGAGEGGVSEYVPTEAEAERSEFLRARGGAPRRWTRRLGMGLGALALVGGGVAYAVQQARQKPKTLREKVMRFVRRK